MLRFDTVKRHVEQQTGRDVNLGMPLSSLIDALQERLQAVAEDEATVLIAQHSGLGKVQLVYDIAVCLLRVVSDDDPVVLNLLRDERNEFFGDFSHTACTYGSCGLRRERHNNPKISLPVCQPPGFTVPVIGTHVL
jgi:hypothetical protein